MPIKFLVDFMLGKLSKHLRILGFDTQYIKEKGTPLSLIKLAERDERILLTRNTKLKEYPCVAFIESENIKDQIQQIYKQFRIDKDVKPFSRCLICNELLKLVSKPEVKGRVPFYIFQTKDKFSLCPKCNKIFWQGTHLKEMKKKIRKIIKTNQKATNEH